MRAKLFGIGLGIALLFPIAAHFLVFIFSPPPEREDFGLNSYRYYAEADVGTKEERLAKADEQEKKDKLFENAVKKHQTHVFYGVYPLGLLAIILGARSRRQAVGGGFIFGAIFAIADGCYSGWDIVPGWLSIASIFLALGVVVLAGAMLEAKVQEPEPS